MTDKEIINRQKAEIERLQAEGETLAIALLKARAEIDRLREINSLVTEAGQEWQKRA